MSSARKSAFPGRRLLPLLLAVLALGSIPAIAVAASGGISTDGPASSGPASSKSNGDGSFPVRSKRVTFGDGLGAGRGHQGQDLLARCGKKVVAAQSGRVVYRDYQASGAGHYVVIRGKKPRFDYVYMHLLKRLFVKKGDRVKAGQPIGRVGSTGRSSACHLHFEMWTKPGWYSGGDVKNPRPLLRKWRRGR